MSSGRITPRAQRVIQCCTCHRVRAGDAWEIRPDIVDAVISHGYCPTCYEEALRRVKTVASETSTRQTGGRAAILATY
ncbi:MAG: hypothetical protein JXR37_33525 [Kiritimatiellae bacterium]|nr:hypothetical protein [Kiritimatiellia bacterium]